VEIEPLLAQAEGLARAAQRAGADEVEAYLWSTRDVEANVVGRLASSRTSHATGVGLRAIVQGRAGHAACSSLSPTHIARATQAAIDAARRAAPRPGFEECLPDRAPGEGARGMYDAAIADADPVLVVREATRVAQESLAHPDVTFSSVLLLHTTFGFAVASTRGVAAADRGTSTKLLSECRARKGSEERTGNDVRVGRRRLDLAQAGGEAVRRALAGMGATPMGKGEMDVLFDRQTSAAVFDLLGNALSGAQAEDKRSFLAGKLGQQVASETLTVHDAPSQGGQRASAFDDEGTPSRDKRLIERGVLRSFLWDARSARRASAKSTANGLRVQEERYRAPPQVATMNLAPEPGGKGFDALVAEMDKGVVVRDAIMGMLQANQVTGDFSLAAPSAWRVERGEIRHALTPVTIAGNAAQALARIGGVARETSASPQGTYPGVWLRGLVCAT
jgi:PmbA protein